MSVDGISSSSDKWTQVRVRKYYRDYLRDLGKLISVEKYGEMEDLSINGTLEYLIEAAGRNLDHQDMGPTFKHTPDPYCGCGPEWPSE